MSAWKHFKTISYHKWLVMKGCFQVGLIRQGLAHDLSKYQPSEFFIGAKYYQGNRSPNNAEREEKGYSAAWLHHKGRNKHHYEYWVDYNTEHGTMEPVQMPVRYTVEMFIDRIAASKVYNKGHYTQNDPFIYYHHGKTEQFLHPCTAKLLEELLEMLRDSGEKKTFQYIRTEILRNRNKTI